MGGAPDEKPTAQERALAEIGSKNFARFKEKFVPVITQNIERSRAKTSDLRQMAAGTSADAANNMGPLKGGPRRQATAMDAQADAIGQASATGATRGSSRLDLKAREMRGLVSGSALGRGIADQGTQGLAVTGQQAQAARQARMQNDQAMRQGLVSAAMTGAGAYGQHKYDIANPKPTPNPNDLPPGDR